MLLLLLLAHLTTAADSPRDTFRDDWKGRAVVLKQPLYTIVYGRDSRFVTIATPDRGIYYSGFFGQGDVLSDRDPQQLAEKVAAMFGETGRPSLLTYPVGSKMRVKNIRIAPGIGYGNRRVWFELYDEFTSGGTATTGLIVEMPADISNDLRERAEVERIAATVFDW